MEIEDARFSQACSLRELAEQHRASGNAAEARAAYEESVRLLRQCDNPLRFAHTIRHLGDVYYEQGERDRAAVAYDEALAVYRSRPDARVLDVANAVRSLAVLRDTEELWQEALDLYRKAGVMAGVANAAGKLALFAWNRGERAQSRKILAEAIDAAETAGSAALDKLEGTRRIIEG